MPNTCRRWRSLPVYVAVILAAAVWSWVAVTIEPLPRLLIPIAIAALPLVVPDRAFRGTCFASAVLMSGVVFLTSLSVGRFLAPSAVALLVGALVRR
jgi:Na+-transporting methylmalonyl-CoA/oxaloacetate decarboxylase beta subunit